MKTPVLKPAPILEKEKISPEMIIDNVRSNIYELFIKKDKNGNPHLNSLESGTINLFGQQNALLLEKSGNKTTIADILEPEYKNALVDAALVSGFFKSFFDNWIYSDGTDEINLYKEIKTHSLGYISGDEPKDVRNDTEETGFISTYEFLHYLRLTNREDTEIHDKLQGDIYNNIIGQLKRNRFSSINSFLRSSIDINFNEEQIGNIKEKYIQELIENIGRRGFEEEHISGIWILERKLGKVEDTEKEKVYNAAVSHLLKELKSDYRGYFTEQFENILNYFGKPPKEPKKHLKTFISNILLDDNFGASDAAYLRSAQELYRRIDRHNKNTDGSFFTGEIVKRGKHKIEATDVKTEMERHIIDKMEDMTDSFGELVNLYDLIFNKEDLRDRVATEAIDSVSRKKEQDSEETVEAYQFNWKDIETKMTEIRNTYPNITLADTSTDEGNAFRKFVRKRIMDEAGKGIVTGLDFWETVLSYDEDIRSPFKDLYAQWYGSEDAKQLICWYDSRYHPLKIARDYKAVFGDYPDEFYNGFKDKAVNCLDSLITETKEKDGVLDEKHARNIRWYLLDDLTYDELFLLPELHKKIHYVNKNYPKISETAISKQFRSC